MNKPESKQSPLVIGLLEKRREILEQLDAIDKVLQAEGYNVAPRHVWQPSSPITKAEAIRRALQKKGKPTKLKDLIIAMEQEGYVFNTSNKPNALNNLLYTKKLPWLGRSSDGFSIKRGADKRE